MNNTYKLSKQMHEAIYSEIKSHYLPKSHPQQAPQAVITGGQPGSGKSSLAIMAVARFGARGGAVLVDADKLRARHPNYKALMENNDKMAADLTHADCGAWAQRLLRDGVEGRRNLVIDQTSRDPAAMEVITNELHRAGYQIELHLMAVPAAISEQRIHQRYENQKAINGYGRFSNKDKHDQAYAGLELTLASVEENKQVDRVYIYNKNANSLYENRQEQGRWINPPGALEAMQRERNRPMDA